MCFPERLGTWLNRAALDDRLMHSHICLVFALHKMCNDQGRVNPFRVSRKLLMAYSKIASTSTYHRCLSELVSYGYMTYQPSYRPDGHSLVRIT